MKKTAAGTVAWTASLGRIALAVLAAWLTLVTLGNVVDALVTLGFLPKMITIASGNFDTVRALTATIGIGWFAWPGFALAVLLELVAAIAFWIAALKNDVSMADAGCVLLLVMFGGFILFDEVSVSYGLEATHRGLIIFTIAVYGLWRFTR